jgi:hypothetical protein
MEFNEFNKLIKMTYIELVDFLREKYGPVPADYFDQESFDKYMLGKTKTIKKNKVSRTEEGLHCHHVDEDKYATLSGPEKVKLQNAGFEHQKKERLVYCNLIEHSIAHVKIAIENQELNEAGYMLGVGGYINFMRPSIIYWNCGQFEPGLDWEKNIHKAIQMDFDRTAELINALDEYLVANHSITFEDIKMAELLWLTESLEKKFLLPL